jgi:predicted membrane GTPase involved in stress response
MPACPIYEGMIIGEHSRGNDLEVNPLKSKQLTNIRTTGEGRSHPPHAAAQDVARAGDRLY